MSRTDCQGGRCAVEEKLPTGGLFKSVAYCTDVVALRWWWKDCLLIKIVEWLHWLDR
jgi:hypothetical protein